MNLKIILEFEGGYLRPLRPVDVHLDYISGLNDQEVNRYLEVAKHIPQTEQSVSEFVRSNQKSFDALLFGIWRTGDNRHCGTIRLHQIEYFHKTAYVGVCLFDKSTWGNKLGSKVIKAVTRWALETLGLHWIEAGIYTENIASQRAFLAAGYEWVYDISGKYVFEGKPTIVKIFAARRVSFPQ